MEVGNPDSIPCRYSVMQNMRSHRGYSFVSLDLTTEAKQAEKEPERFLQRHGLALLMMAGAVDTLLRCSLGFGFHWRPRFDLRDGLARRGLRYPPRGEVG